jgi:hypothetical protein
MPYLGGVYLNTVYSDKPSRSVRTTDHPIEQGESIVDHIERIPVTISISGVVTGPDAAARLAKLEDLQNKGALLTYTHRVKYDNVIIEKFDSDHGKEVAGGFTFSMTLKRVRMVKAAPIKVMKLPQRVQAKKVTNKGRQQTKKGQPTAIEKKAEFLRRKGLE